MIQLNQLIQKFMELRLVMLSEPSELILHILQKKHMDILMLYIHLMELNYILISRRELLLLEIFQVQGTILEYMFKQERELLLE